MIIIKDKSKQSSVHIVKTYSDGYSGNYSIVLQNTLTKQITIFQTLEDIGNPLYHMFTIDVSSLEDGEYYLQLLKNKHNYPIVTNPNNITNIGFEQDAYIYIMNGNDYITNESFYLVLPDSTNKKTIKQDVLSSELLRIGEYTSPTSQYNSEKKYLQYNG